MFAFERRYGLATSPRAIRRTLGDITSSSGPFFLPDFSSYQGVLPDFNAVASAPNMVGCILKASEGVGPGTSSGQSADWFIQNWPRVRAAGGPRYGQSWFRGCYCFGSPTSTGQAQADYLINAVNRAGGWGAGDMPPAWDLEGAKWTSQQQIVDVSSAFAARIKQQLGKAPILYSGATWRQYGITTRAGFDQLWTTHMDSMAAYNWPNSTIALLQYSGGSYYDPSSGPAQAGYPIAVPGLSTPVDMNVVMDGGSPASSIERVRAVLTGQATSIAKRIGAALPFAIGAGVGLLALGFLAVRAKRAAVTLP